MRYNKGMQREQAFTLIELLVVIAIISILAVLLSPALKLAKDTAIQAHCTSNVRQLAVALRQFSLDHKGYLPPHRTVTSDGSGFGKVWMQWLNDSEIVSWMGQDQPVQGIFRCPARPPLSQGTPNPPWAWTDYRGTHFGINYWIAPENRDTDPFPPGSSGRRRRSSNVPSLMLVGNPSHLYLVGDSGMHSVNDAIRAGYPSNDFISGVMANESNDNYWGSRQPDTTRHPNGANIACVDGHVERVVEWVDYADDQNDIHWRIQ